MPATVSHLYWIFWCSSVVSQWCQWSRKKSPNRCNLFQPTNVLKNNVILIFGSVCYQQLKDFEEMLGVLLWFQQRYEWIPLIKLCCWRTRKSGCWILKRSYPFFLSFWSWYINLSCDRQSSCLISTITEQNPKSWFSAMIVIQIINPLSSEVHWDVCTLAPQWPDLEVIPWLYSRASINFNFQIKLTQDFWMLSIHFP